MTIKHPLLVIEAGQSEKNYWRDLWMYRELFFFLAWRDIMVRYKQTAIGIAWAFLRPLATMLVFTLIFGKLAKMPSEGVPYPILVFSALLPWQLFASSFSGAGESLVGSGRLISKIYFPRMVVPASAMIVSVVDFLISSFILVCLMFWYGYEPTIRMLALPLFVVFALAAAFGVGLWVATLNVRYRDFRIIVPFIVQFGLYISPVGFSSTVVPEQWRLFYSVNPMVGVIEGFRWAILGGESQLYWPGFTISITLVVILFVSGVWYFRKAEKTFADVI